MSKYIGCNFNNGAYYGGIDSSFNRTFKDEEVLIESGIGDIVPCIIGNISEAYDILKRKIKEKNTNDFNTICICVYETIEEYFNGINNISNRMKYYKPLDEIETKEDIGKVSSLKGTGAAMCTERAMLAQNLLKSLNINSFYKCSGIKKNGEIEVHSYNLIEHDNKYYIFDSSIPTVEDKKVTPLIATIPKEVFDKISSSEQRIGYSVEVSHYNPIRNNDVTIIYDSGREFTYYQEQNKNKQK